jgi:[acyl-carrier-protein] S-malonyltransferase
MLGVLCSGQGGQYPGMFEVLAGEGAGLAVLDACEAELGADLRALARAGGAGLYANRSAQLLICAFQIAVWTGLRARGLPVPRVIAGYSVGELSAYACAGAVEPQRLVALAQLRAKAMDAVCPRRGRLVAVRGLSRDALERLCCIHGVEIAIVNGFDRVVVGGVEEALGALVAEVCALGARVTVLSAPIASHTSLMAPALPAFAAALAEAGLRAPSFPVLAGVDGAPVFDAGRAAATLTEQMARAIDWAACMESMGEMGCTAILELGPGDALSRMYRDRQPHVQVRSVCEFRTLAGVVAWAGRRARG